MNPDNAKDYSSFFLKDPLYNSYSIKDFTTDDLINILFFDPDTKGYDKLNALDSYCPFCKKETSFVSKSTDKQMLMDTAIGLSIAPEKTLKELEKTSIFIRTFFCPRAPNDPTHDQVYIFSITNEKLIKIGQHPPLADLSRDDIKKYQKINQEVFKELNRAIGLASHGIGVGSYVYLRRIIEKYIVNPKLEELLKNGTLSEGDVEKVDFKQKIALLKDDLPDFLVQNKNVYSFLSKGLHELDEQECTKYFPVVLTSIEIILDEQIENIEKEKKKKEISNQLNKLK